MKQITIYTDGSSLGNPGPGGYGTVLISGQHRKELAEGFKLTTNNRMELLAVIKGLEAIKSEGQDVHIYSDSKYVIDAIEKKWVFGWVKKDFKDKKNKDLWLRLLKTYSRQNVSLHWVKGHSGVPENERCDQLAVAAAKGGGLIPDKGYTNENTNTIL